MKERFYIAVAGTFLVNRQYPVGFEFHLTALIDVLRFMLVAGLAFWWGDHASSSAQGLPTACFINSFVVLSAVLIYSFSHNFLLLNLPPFFVLFPDCLRGV